MSEPEYILYHRIVEPESARIRLQVVDLGLKPRVEFLNAETDGRDDPRLGSAGTPALWDGRRLISGEAAVLAALRAIASGR